jgi:transcriptional regulator with XRE-family HTH domain
MDPIEIQYRLRRKGISQKSIAQSLQVSDNAVSLIIKKRMVSARIMQAVADAIGIDVHLVFHEHFVNKAA